MAAGDLALNILINASQGNTSSVIGQIGKSLMGLASGAGPLGAIVGVGAAAAGALVGVGVAAVKAAGDFQAGITSLATGAGEAQANLKMVGDGIKQMAIDTGTSTDQLIKGMYMIESAGFHGAQGLAVLKAAAEGAKVGNADLGVTANAVTTILTDYHMSGSQAAQAMNALTATVAAGKTHLQDLANSMGSVLPLASSLGISFPQVAGAIATMTNAGMSAQRASMNLANAIRSLAAPGAIAQKSMKDVGISAQELKDTLSTKGLAAAIQLIEEHVNKKFPAGSVQAVEAFKAIMGGATGYNVALMLGGKNMATYEADIKSIAEAMGVGGNAVKGWDLIQQGFNFRMDQAKQALNVFLIVLGEKLLPLVTPIVAGFTNMIAGITKFLTGLGSAGASSKEFNGVLGMLAVTGNYLSGIFKLLGEGVGIVFGSQFKQASMFVSAFAKGAVGGLNSVLFTIEELLDPIVHGLLPAMQRLQQAFAGNLIAGIQSFASAISKAFGQNFGSLDKSMAGIVPVIDLLSKGINTMAGYMEKLKPVFQDLGTYIGNQFGPVFKQLSETFNQQIKPAWDRFVASIGPAMPAFKLLGQILGVVIVGAIKLFAKNMADMAKAGVIVFGFLVQGAIDFATGIMQAIGQAVQIWNDLQSAWNAAPAFFQGLWDDVKKAFQKAWGWIAGGAKSSWTQTQNAWGATGQWFQNIGHGIQKGIGDAWTWIQTTSKTIWNDIVKIITTPIQNIVGQFQWLYNHNYYFADLVNFIKKTFQDGITWIQNIWTGTGVWLQREWAQISRDVSDQWGKISQTIQDHIAKAIKFLEDKWKQASDWLTAQWNGLSKMASNAWKKVSDAVGKAWNDISTALGDLWKNISGWWNNVVAQTVTFANDMWKQVSAAISQAWSKYVSTPLNTLWNNMKKWFTNLGTSFQTWMTNAMKMMGTSIQNGITYVTTAVTNLGNEIAKLLGFHSPPATGPLATSDQWMPNFMKMLADGVTANKNVVTNAITSVAQIIADLMKHLSPAKTGPLAGDDQWMPNMMTMFARGVTLNSYKVTNAFTNLATGIKLQMNLIDNTVQTGTQKIGTQLATTQQQVATTTTQMGTQFTLLSTQIQQTATTVQQTSTQMGQNFINVGKIVSTTSQQTQQATTAISQGANDCAQNVGKAASTMQVHFGNTSQYVTRSVKDISESVKDAQIQVDEVNKHSQAGIKAMADNVKATLTGDVVGQVTSFVSFVGETARTAVAEAKWAADQIAAYLGHSKPRMGPLRDDDSWGKHFMENIVGGIQSGMPMLTGVTNSIAGVLSQSMAVPSLSVSSSGVAPSPASAIIPLSNQPIVIHNYTILDGRQVGKSVTKYQQNELRAQGGVRNI